MDQFERLSKFFSDVWHLELYRSAGNAVYLNQLIVAFFVVVIGILISKRVCAFIGNRLLKVNNLNRDTAHFIQRLLFYILVVVIVLIALPIAGIPVTVFAVMGGAIAIGVGFGTQNLFNNLISGIILMLEKPIRIGDIVHLEGFEGRIEEIGNRCVRVRRSDGIDLIVPNNKFLEDVVVNWTLMDGDVRGLVTVGVAYGSATKKVKELMLRSAEEHPDILKNREAVVLFEDFGDSALIFELCFWTSVTRPMHLRKIESDLRFRIDELFNEHDLVIAFPQQDVHLDTTKPLEIKLNRSES